MTTYNPATHPRLATWEERRRKGITRMRCPQCGRVGYKPYLWPDGEVVAEDCGKCDHESSCGFHRPPSDALRGVVAERKARDVEWQSKPVQRLEIPLDFVRKSYRPDGCVLVQWLRSLPLNADQRENLRLAIGLYAVGTTKEGDAIWWQIDREMVVRSGKIMRYRPNGRRWKDEDGRGRMNWVHSVMQRKGLLPGPDVAQYVGCLFGEHLLKSLPEAEVHVVESEKSALICAALDTFARRLWMATGGLQLLSAERLRPLIEEGRTIVVYPDHDGYAKWVERVERIGYERLAVSPYVEDNWREGTDPDNADIADLLLRQLATSPQARLEEMQEEYPALRTLADKMGLEPWPAV